MFRSVSVPRLSSNLSEVTAMAYGQTVKTPSAPLKQKHSYRGQKELECKGTMAGVHNGLPCSDTVLSDGISEALTMQPPWTPPEPCWLCLHSFAQGLGWPLGCPEAFKNIAVTEKVRLILLFSHKYLWWFIFCYKSNVYYKGFKHWIGVYKNLCHK